MSTFRKLEKIQVSLKSVKNNVQLTWTAPDFLIISRSIFLRMRNVSDKVVEKIKTHILCSITFFFSPENRAVYEIMWKNIVERGRPQMTICFSTATMVARTRLSATLYVHSPSCTPYVCRSTTITFAENFKFHFVAKHNVWVKTMCK